MLKKYSQYYSKILIFSDILSVSLSWLLAYILRFHLNILPNTNETLFNLYSPLIIIIALVWYFVFSVFGLYRFENIMKRTKEVQEAVKAHITAILVLVFLTYIFSEYKYSRLVMFYFSILSISSIIFNRMFLRNVIRNFRRKSPSSDNAIIIGTGYAAKELVWLLDKYAELGIKIKGMLSSNKKEINTTIKGIEVLGKFEDLEKIIKEKNIKKVFIALDELNKEEREYSESILKTFKDETIDLVVVPPIIKYVSIGCAIEQIDHIPLIILNDSPIAGFNTILKRIEDIVLSFFGILAFSPVMIVVALLVKFSSKGPILYKQERMGLDGKTFHMYKFRSMKIDAEQKTGAVWATADDDRKTLVGGFLRKTSLDELPQFFNVLLGHMSMVGPRPERPVFVEKFKTEIPGYMLRHKVKAGVTGWAQVNGWRGNTSLEKRIECDLFYIRNWSITFDIKILFLTVWKGFVNKNAY